MWSVVVSLLHSFRLLVRSRIAVSQSTVAKYMRRHWRPPSQTWRTFLTNHASQIMAADLFVVPTVSFRLLFVLIMLAHDRRQLVHVAVTAHPTAAWTAQQLRNAFSDNNAPRYLVHDRDSVFADVATTIERMNIHEVRTAPRSPWQNTYEERVIGSIRRECLDHVIVVNATGLHQVLTAYVTYYMQSRTHQALQKDAPISRPVVPSAVAPTSPSTTAPTQITRARRRNGAWRLTERGLNRTQIYFVVATAAFGLNSPLSGLATTFDQESAILRPSSKLPP